MGMVCYRLWEWYVTAYGNGMLPLMGMVCYRLWEWYVTAYSNVLQSMVKMSYRLWQKCLTDYGKGVLHYMTRLSYSLCKSVLQFTAIVLTPKGFCLNLIEQ